MRFYWGENFEYATLVPITSQERTKYLSNGVAVSVVIGNSPVNLVATRTDAKVHVITGGVAPTTINQTYSPPACVIQSMSYASWTINDDFTNKAYTGVFTQNRWPFFLQIGFLDSMPDKMLVGFVYWHFVSPVFWPFNPFLPVGYPYFLQWAVQGTFDEVDRSQFGFACSSFKPGVVTEIFDVILSGQALSPLPSGAGYSVSTNVTVNNITVPIQDPPKYYFEHKPSDGSFPSYDGNTYTSIVPQGAYSLNSLSAQLNAAVTISPIEAAP